MKKPSRFFVLLPLFAFCACEPVAVQYPPGSAQYPSPNSVSSSTAPQAPEVSGSQRWQHAWNRAMEGVAMGGAIAGPYGAGGGLIIGLLTGLVTADSHYGQINNQIYTEQRKDQQLEAAIEQELARQRELESQIAGTAVPAQPAAPELQPVAAKNQPPSAAPAQAPIARPVNQTSVAVLTKPPTDTAAPKPFKNVEVRDVNGDGVPDLWVYYDPQRPGEIVRQEEASQADGRVDTWSYFKDGKLIRREVDTRQTGRPDRVYFYDGDKIAREERDESGQGSMTYRALYDNGRLARVEKDSTGRGRTDLWIYYDTAGEGEIVVREERDLNGDGSPDLWSHFENGRLARRDVSAIGLEILSKKEQLPASAMELIQASAPGK
jgi:hypothetical protein